MAKGDLQALRDNLQKSQAARTRFLASALDLLEQHGVDVNDPKVANQLGLHNIDLTNGATFLKSMMASSIVVTVTA